MRTITGVVLATCLLACIGGTLAGASSGKNLSTRVHKSGYIPVNAWPLGSKESDKVFRFPKGYGRCKVKQSEEATQSTRRLEITGDTYTLFVEAKKGTESITRKKEVQSGFRDDLKELDEKYPSVLTVGAGPTGILSAILARSAGTFDVVIDRSPFHEFSGDESKYFVFKREQVLRLDEPSLNMLKQLKHKKFRKNNSVYEALVELEQEHDGKKYAPPGTLIDPGYLVGEPQATDDRLIHVKVNVLQAILTEYYMSMDRPFKAAPKSPLYNQDYRGLLSVSQTFESGKFSEYYGALIETVDPESEETICYIQHFRNLVGADGRVSAVRRSLSRHLTFLRERVPLIDNILTNNYNVPRAAPDAESVVDNLCSLPYDDDLLYYNEPNQEIAFGAVGLVEEPETRESGERSHRRNTNIHDAYFSFCDPRYCFGSKKYKSGDRATVDDNTVGVVVRSFHAEPFYHDLIDKMESVKQSTHYIGLGLNQENMNAMMKTYKARTGKDIEGPAYAGSNKILQMFSQVGKRGPITFDQLRPEMMALFNDVKSMLQIKGKMKCIDRWPSVFPICIYGSRISSWTLTRPQSAPAQFEDDFVQWINIEGDAARGPNFLTWGGANSAWDGLQSSVDPHQSLKTDCLNDRHCECAQISPARCANTPISMIFQNVVNRENIRGDTTSKDALEKKGVCATKLLKSLLDCKNSKNDAVTDHLLQKGLNCNLALSSEDKEQFTKHMIAQFKSHGYVPTCTPVIGGEVPLLNQPNHRLDLNQDNPAYELFWTPAYREMPHMQKLAEAVNRNNLRQKFYEPQCVCAKGPCN